MYESAKFSPTVRDSARRRTKYGGDLSRERLLSEILSGEERESQSTFALRPPALVTPN